MGIRSLISYEGNDARSLVEDFHGAVDDYLLLCEENGKIPEKAYKGSFNIRIAPETHKKLVIHATACICEGNVGKSCHVGNSRVDKTGIFAYLI